VRFIELALAPSLAPGQASGPALGPSPGPRDPGLAAHLYLLQAMQAVDMPGGGHGLDLGELAGASAELARGAPGGGAARAAPAAPAAPAAEAEAAWAARANLAAFALTAVAKLQAQGHGHFPAGPPSAHRCLPDAQRRADLSLAARAMVEAL
jgi:hypothetical protein